MFTMPLFLVLILYLLYVLAINLCQINVLVKIFQMHALILVQAIEYYLTMNVFVLQALLMMEKIINVKYATKLG